jgi:hypothetical protein
VGVGVVIPKQKQVQFSHVERKAKTPMVVRGKVKQL